MKIKIIKGDITNTKVDVIVNAANSSLLGGGGVDGAIHRKGGAQILEDCIKIRNKQGGCKTGEAVCTSAGLLPAKYIIHTVGPVWNGGKGKEKELLANCYHNSLHLANNLEIETIAFPNISTGIYKFPKKEAAKIAFQSVIQFSIENKHLIQEVIFVCFDQDNFNIYQEEQKKYVQ